MTGLTSDLTDEQYAAIGKVVCEWAHVEFMTRHLIGAICDMTMAECRVATAKLQGDDLLNRLLKAAVMVGRDGGERSPLYQHLAALVPTWNELRLKRNDIVHFEWLALEDGTAGAVPAFYRGPPREQMVMLTVAEATTCSLNMAAMHDRLLAVLLHWQDGKLEPLVHG